MEDRIFRPMAGSPEKQETLDEIDHTENSSGYGKAKLHVLKTICGPENANAAFPAKILHLTEGAIGKTVRRPAVKRLIEPYMRNGEPPESLLPCCPAEKYMKSTKRGTTDAGGPTVSFFRALRMRRDKTQLTV